MDKNSLITYRIFTSFSNLVAFTTDKRFFNNAGVQRFTGGDMEEIDKNRKKLATLLDIMPRQLVFPRQSHTNCVVHLTKLPEKELINTDALVTNQPGICLCVQTADCVPILLFDPVNNVIAAVHSGWRGTVKRIVREAVQNMNDKFASIPRNVRAVIGPSIGPDVYEVGREVADEVQKTVPRAHLLLHENLSGRFHLNLWEANRQILQGCGIPSQNIETAGECTFSNQKKYFSARREGVNSGRIVSGIILKEVDNN